MTLASDSRVYDVICLVCLTDLMEVIAWLLHPNENHRATLQDIKRDPWVQQPIRIDDYKWKKVLPNCGEWQRLHDQGLNSQNCDIELCLFGSLRR